MNWSDSIALEIPLRDARLLSKAPAQDWQEHVREREEAAYERGKRDGERALSEQLLQQRNEMAELQRGVIASLQSAVPQVVKETENALIDLALQAAQKIVADVPITVEMVEGVVREAAQQAESSVEIIVQLHPEDLALLRKNSSPLLNGLPETGPLRFVNASEVTRGGCIVQTRFGLIDARRETKLEQLRKTLTE